MRPTIGVHTEADSKYAVRTHVTVAWSVCSSDLISRSTGNTKCCKSTNARTDTDRTTNVMRWRGTAVGGHDAPEYGDKFSPPSARPYLQLEGSGFRGTPLERIAEVSVAAGCSGARGLGSNTSSRAGSAGSPVDAGNSTMSEDSSDRANTAMPSPARTAARTPLTPHATQVIRLRMPAASSACSSPTAESFSGGLWWSGLSGTGALDGKFAKHASTRRLRLLRMTVFSQPWLFVTPPTRSCRWHRGI